MSSVALITSNMERIMSSLALSSSNQPDSLLMGRLPDELILRIFTFLTPEEVASTSRVCRKWNRLGSDESLWTAFLKKLFPSLKILNEETWKAHADLNALELSVDDVPPFDNRKIIPELKRLFASLKIEGDAGITLLTMPRGLTFNKIVTLARSPIQGDPVKFSYIWPRILEELGNKQIEKTHKIAITNSVLKESRDLSVRDQQELVNKSGCEMPGVLPAVTLAILTYISSQEKPPTSLYNNDRYKDDEPRDNNPYTMDRFNNNPLFKTCMTYTRCCESVDHYNLIGCLFPSGLLINHDECFDSKYIGVGAMRKF